MLPESEDCPTLVPPFKKQVKNAKRKQGPDRLDYARQALPLDDIAWMRPRLSEEKVDAEGGASSRPRLDGGTGSPIIWTIPVLIRMRLRCRFPTGAALYALTRH